MTYEIEPEEIPEEDIPRESARFLLQTYQRLNEKLKQPMLRDERGVLGLARCYLFRVLTFVMCDRRYHPGESTQINACRIFRAEGGLLPQYVGWLTEINLPLATLGNDLRILHISADIFFDCLQNVFDLKEIRKCRMAFDILMQSLAAPDVRASAANYLRRHKTMSRAVENWRENGGTVRDDSVESKVKAMENRLTELQAALEENTKSVDANTRTVANMDRRQKRFFTFLAPVQQKIAAIFHRKDKDPYAAVTVPEPRRSQLIEVIDYTMTHPIVHDSKSRDEFTLSNAARAVWNLRHKTWESTEGGYETFGALKGACYGLQKKQNDPFWYRQ